MKMRFTCLVLAFTFLLLTQLANAQSDGDYRTIATGNWNALPTWERYNGTTMAWEAAVAVPTSADGVITIRSPHTVSIIVPRTADQLIVDAGATLNVTAGGANQLTLNNGVGDDIVVNGTLNIGTNFLAGIGTTALINGTLNLLDASTIQATTTISATGIVNLTNNATKTFAANFTNNGTFNWGTGMTLGGIQLTNSSTFTNNGTINEQYSSSRGFFNAAGSSFINNGTFNKTTTFTVNVGTLAFTNSATGVIKGSGAISAAGTTTVTNAGTVSPGSSPGTFTLSPNMLAGTTGNVLIEILDGSGAGTGHDQLALTGNTNLNGVTITVTEIAPGNTAPLGMYTILTTSGTFSGTPTIVKTDNYTVTVNSNTIVAEKIALFPLPAKWGDFSAVVNNNNQVKLRWTTLQETNVENYMVEASTDGQHYNVIGTVAAAGNTTDETAYSFIHTTPDLQRTNYYRIKQTDFDGKTAYSAIRQVRFTKGTVVNVIASPNPVSDVLQVSVQQEKTHIMLVDLSGRTLMNQDMQVGYNELNVSKLSAGLYQLVIFQDGIRTGSMKIMKQ